MWFFSYYARRFVRSFMKPIHPVIAKKWLIRARVMYVVVGFTTLGYAWKCYQTKQTEIELYKDLDPTYSHKMSRLRGEPGKMKVVRFTFSKGFETFEYDNEEYIRNYNKRRTELDERLKTEKDADTQKDTETNGTVQ